MSIQRSKENKEFLLVLALLTRPNHPSGMIETIKQHARAWEKVGLIPRIPVASGMTKKRIREYVQKICCEENEKK